MDLKTMKRSKLTEALNAQKDALKKDQFFITSVRAVKDGQLQVEVCQNRILAGRKRTLLGALNKSDKRFRGATTLLFDWMLMQPEDLISVFPALKGKVTLEDLKAMAATHNADSAKGKDAPVFKLIYSIDKIFDAESGDNLTPIIAVTEVTHKALLGGEFYKGTDAQDKIDNELEKGTAVMRASSEDDAEYIVDGETGQRVYRFTRTMFKEDYPAGDWDTIIPNKTAESVYKKGERSMKAEKSPEQLLVGDDHI